MSYFHSVSFYKPNSTKSLNWFLTHRTMCHLSHVSQRNVKVYHLPHSADPYAHMCFPPYLPNRLAPLFTCCPAGNQVVFLVPHVIQGSVCKKVDNPHPHGNADGLYFRFLQKALSHTGYKEPGEHQVLQECTAYFLYLILTLRTTLQWIPTVLVKYPYHDPENPARSSLSLPLQSSFHSPF